MLKQCSPSVRSEGDPVSGRSKTKETACTGLWLRPVYWDRTCLVVILGVLDLSGIDRTLGGSVRSLHRSVRSIENVRDSNSYLVFLLYHGQGPPYNRHRLT